MLQLLSEKISNLGQHIFHSQIWFGKLNGNLKWGLENYFEQEMFFCLENQGMLKESVLQRNNLHFVG